jgi:rare lipoprotein A (peptidoglycan hydrolase)
MMIIASMVLLVSATVWEGVSEADSAGEVPGNFSVATNSFPRNTVVDITNLENGKMVRVRVVSGLEQAGLLAMLSRSAAESIDLRGNSSVRIRMTQPPDNIAFSLFNLGPIVSPSSLAKAPQPAELSRLEADRADGNASVTNSNTIRTDGNTGITDSNTLGMDANTGIAETFTASTDNATALADSSNTVSAGKLSAAENSPLPYNQPYNQPYNSASNLLSPLVAVIPDTPPEAAYGEPGLFYGRLTLIPSEERLPTSTGYVIAPEDIIPSIGAAIAAQPEAEYVPPIERFSPVEAAVTEQTEVEYIPPMVSFAEFSPFQAPLISRLEPNKWYVQVALYGRADYVEEEISRIGMSYPLAVQNIGTDANPLFRILLGPLNQGESGAMLQRFKSLGYADAFVRYN